MANITRHHRPLPRYAYLADDMPQAMLGKAALPSIELHLQGLAEQIDLTWFDRWHFPPPFVSGHLGQYFLPPCLQFPATLLQLRIQRQNPFLHRLKQSITGPLQFIQFALQAFDAWTFGNHCPPWLAAIHSSN